MTDVEIYKSVHGKPLDAYIAHMPNVQWGVYNEAYKAGMRAENLLADHRVSNMAEIEVSKGTKPDSFVSLIDRPSNEQRPGALTAFAIEFGRVGFIDTDYPEGDPRRYWGAFPGLHIMSRIAKRYGKVAPARGRAKKREILTRRAAYGAIARRLRDGGSE